MEIPISFLSISDLKIYMLFLTKWKDRQNCGFLFISQNSNSKEMTITNNHFLFMDIILQPLPAFCSILIAEGFFLNFN